jgi:hypothetical protein
MTESNLDGGGRLYRPGTGSKTGDIFGVSIESHDSPRFAHETRSAETDDTDVRADVIHDGAFVNGKDRFLREGISLPTPITCFFRKACMDPQSPR